MHHTLPFYGRYRRKFLRIYILLAQLTHIPLLGRLVRWIANNYGRTGHGGYFLTLEEAEQLIDVSNSVALGPCGCRQAFHNCDRPIMTEIVVGAGRELYYKVKNKGFHQVSKKKAKEVMQQCHGGGMMHTVMQCQGLFYAICNCCSCCCVPYRLKNNHGIEYAMTRNKSIIADFEKQQL